MSEITNPTIEIDFTGHSPVGGLSLGYLTAGTHAATIMESRQYEDNQTRLYIYMSTDGIRHRDSFNLTGAGVGFLMGIFQSAGVPANKMTGKGKFPTKNLVGKTVHFQYTPPQLEADGRRVDGSYPKYRYYTKAEYEQVMASSSETPTDFSVEDSGTQASPTNGSNGSPIPPASSEEDFDFLLKG